MRRNWRSSAHARSGILGRCLRPQSGVSLAERVFVLHLLARVHVCVCVIVISIEVAVVSLSLSVNVG